MRAVLAIVLGATWFWVRHPDERRDIAQLSRDLNLADQRAKAQAARPVPLARPRYRGQGERQHPGDTASITEWGSASTG